MDDCRDFIFIGCGVILFLILLFDVLVNNENIMGRFLE